MTSSSSSEDVRQQARYEDTRAPERAPRRGDHLRQDDVARQPAAADAEAHEHAEGKQREVVRRQGARKLARKRAQRAEAEHGLPTAQVDDGPPREEARDDGQAARGVEPVELRVGKTPFARQGLLDEGENEGVDGLGGVGEGGEKDEVVLVAKDGEGRQEVGVQYVVDGEGARRRRGGRQLQRSDLFPRALLGRHSAETPRARKSVRPL
ncbi:hypothetical protein FGB62_49g219 [Gracilaria domingensis]|nr:hypothetical protein FGB62_49g219 [Gracilaria domingensis]